MVGMGPAVEGWYEQVRCVEGCGLTFVDQRLCDFLPLLSPTYQPYSNGYTLPGEPPIIVLVSNAPNVTEDVWLEFSTSEYLDGDISSENTAFLRVCLKKYEGNEGELCCCRSKRGGHFDQTRDVRNERWPHKIIQFSLSKRWITSHA